MIQHGDDACDWNPLSQKTRTRFVVHVKHHGCWWPGPQSNIKMSSYQYRKSRCVDKTILRQSYLHNGISYTGKMIYMY